MITVPEQRLSPNFTLHELIRSETAARRGIDNTPAPEIIENLRHLAEFLQLVKALLGGGAILISSAFRCLLLNVAAGGAQKPLSYHTQGLAADFTCPSFGTPYEVARALAASDLPYDKVIYEFGDWVHVQIAKPGEIPRRETYTIFSAAEGYLPGIREHREAA